MKLIKNEDISQFFKYEPEINLKPKFSVIEVFFDIVEILPLQQFNCIITKALIREFNLVDLAIQHGRKAFLNILKNLKFDHINQQAFNKYEKIANRNGVTIFIEYQNYIVNYNYFIRTLSHSELLQIDAKKQIFIAVRLFIKFLNMYEHILLFFR